jgi:hypothetical protein
MFIDRCSFIEVSHISQDELIEKRASWACVKSLGNAMKNNKASSFILFILACILGLIISMLS